MTFTRHCIHCGEPFTVRLAYGRRELGRKKRYCNSSCRAMASQARIGVTPPSPEDFSDDLIELLYRRAKAQQRYERARSA